MATIPDDEPLDENAARALALAIFAAGDVRISAHARARMALRGVSLDDIVRFVRSGSLVLVDFVGGAYRYEFSPRSGRSAVIAFESDTEIVIITTWKDA